MKFIYNSEPLTKAALNLIRFDPMETNGTMKEISITASSKEIKIDYQKVNQDLKTISELKKGSDNKLMERGLYLVFDVSKIEITSSENSRAWVQNLIIHKHITHSPYFKNLGSGNDYYYYQSGSGIGFLY